MLLFWRGFPLEPTALFFLQTTGGLGGLLVFLCLVFLCLVKVKAGHRLLRNPEARAVSHMFSPGFSSLFPPKRKGISVFLKEKRGFSRLFGCK